MINTKPKTFAPNKKQQEAIDNLTGPVMLLAGPGTGKTFTLIRRIEKMLDEGISPSSILCLTFSDAASNEMKTRLIEEIGLEAAGVNVSTYHSFCMDLIRQYNQEFELKENFQMADDVTVQAILKECIDEYSAIKPIEFLKDKWNNKYHYISEILKGIAVIKRERTTKTEYFQNIENLSDWQPKLDELYEEKAEREKNNKLTKTCLSNIENQEKKIGKAKEFYSIFEIFKRKLQENNLIDYSDMINLVLDKMENDENFLVDAVKHYKYVLVDEYQDTSKVQNQIIFNILRGAKTDNIFVVGDDDQIIYSFQGAMSRNLNDFLTHFKNTKIICLEENRRSTQTVLNFAEELIKNDKFRLVNDKTLGIEKKLIAKNEKIISKEQKIDFNIYADALQETNNITEQIENLIKNGTEASEISILTRKNDKLEVFARLLEQKNIPYALSKQRNAFEIPAFIQTYFYLKLLNNSFIEQDKFFALLSFEPFKISDKTIAKFLFLSRKTSDNLIKIAQDNLEDELSELKSFYNTFEELKIKKNYTPLMAYLYEVITKTGILEFYSNINTKERFENIQAIQRLIDEARSYLVLHKGAVLGDFLSHLDDYFAQDIKIELKKNTFKKNAVQLLTYHGSKGREFEHVFMPDLNAKSFEEARTSVKEMALPIQKSVFSDDKDENKDAELLRLLFVGITRAKFGLHLSYSNTIDSKPQNVSKYISELFPENDCLINKTIFELDENAQLEEIVKDIRFYPKDDYRYELEKRVEELILSQTALNKYINCPLQYFYSDILKVPVFIEDKDVLSYGSSIHYAIDFMTKNAMQNKAWGNIEEMVNKFLEKMDELEFTSFEKKQELIERGKNSIEKNYPKLIEANPEYILSTEYKMETKFNNCSLKGFADRITTDNEGNIHIFDFKTGSHKKIKEDSNYYNQLRFYKFLYETLNPNKKVVETSLIYFEEGCKTSTVEPDLTNNEEIKEKIKNTIDSIKSFDFEPIAQEETCKYCNYKLICKLYLNQEPISKE